MTPDLGALFSALHAAVRAAASPESAWADVVRLVDETGFRVPPDVRDTDIAAEVAIIARQLRAALDADPPPPDLTLLHFGLFDRVVPGSRVPAAGFYFAGGRGDPVTALAQGALILPELRYLDRPLLERIKRAGQALGDDYNVFDYGLTIGAAGLLGRFAARDAGTALPVSVGFDSGDYEMFG